MCRAVTCKRCGKTTWAGCGQHVDDVMKNVPNQDRCTCADQQASSAQGQGGGVFGRLFGR